ncbi:MAG: leucyl aminopeptidase [Rhodospirillaceae bacterium]|nr:leucyl aminopeptidase [Rhodospirillaceae bacterium]
MKIAFAKLALPAAGTVVIVLPAAPEKAAKAGVKLSRVAAQLDRRAKGALTRAISAAEFAGKKDASLVIPAPAGGKLKRVILWGVGPAKDFDAATAEKSGAALYGQVSGDETVSVLLEDLPDAATSGARMASGMRLKSYRFDKYRTKTDANTNGKPKIKALNVLSDDPAAAKQKFAPLNAVADGVFFTRDLVTEPPNVIYPESFAQKARELAADGVKIEVLGEKEMKKLGMGALLGVGQGSLRESKLLVMQWLGGHDKDSRPLAIVGKGVCFDSGGISLKPGAGMWDMKWDMGGAGAVTGLMRALARRKSTAHVIGLCGLVENMPDGGAQRPGDVVTSMSGQTIEVLNTDAEGRLVLADVLTYAQEKYKPRAILDLATLTGAIVQALSEHYAGIFSNNDELADKIVKAGQATGERLWRFPMGEEYDKDIKSPIADMKNIGGGKAGSITAAQFLQRFIKDGLPWAHLDIAGVVWNDKGTALSAGGATGYGVRLLDRFVAENYE